MKGGFRHARLALTATIALAVAPRTAWADPKDDARRHFVAGLEAAKSGDYEVALQHFLAAQDAYPHPSTLYNIARSYQDLDDLPNALTYYRLYRDADPTKAADVDPVIAVIEARLRQQTGSVAQVTPTAPVTGVNADVVARLQALAAEMQAKVDEVNALTEAIAIGSATTETSTGAEPETAGSTTSSEPIPELPEGGFITDAYQRIVVTASRYGQEPIDSPSAVTILTADDIRLSGATSFADVLRRVVGVDAMALSSGHTDVSIRGFNRELSNKVLILIDGRSTYMDFIGTTLWSSLPITLDEVERIEIIRGPGSAVYGANAVTGVINIITKTPGEGGNQLRFESGTSAYGQGMALGSGREGPTAYRFSAGYVQAGRWAKEYDPALASREFFVDNQDLGQQTLTANGRIDRTFGPLFVSLSGGFADTVAEFYNIGALGDYYIDFRHHYMRGDVAAGPAHLRMFWNSNVGETGSWSEPADWVRSLTAEIDTDVLDFELEGSHEIDSGPIHHRLNAGVGYRYKFTRFGYIPDDIKEHHANAFVQEEATVSRLKLVASLRADRHPLLPLTDTLSPRGAAIFRVRDDTSIRVTGGTAFRAPNHTENYMDFVLPTSTDAAFLKDYGDTELRPERIVTAEIGVHDESTPFHTADLTMYVNRLTDIIFLRDVQSAVDPTDPQLEYDDEIGGYLAGETGWTNTPSVYTGYGVEAEAEVFPIDGLDVYGNVAIAQIYETDEEGERSRDESTSAVKVNAGVTYRTPFRTDLSLHGNYASGQTWGLRSFDSAGHLQVYPQTVDPRLILSARVGVRPFDDDALEVAVGCWNLGAIAGDAGILGRFKEHPKGQPVGPRAFASVTTRF